MTILTNTLSRADRQIKLINDRIFQYLTKYPQLQRKDILDYVPSRLVMRYHLTGCLNFSKSTLECTGQMMDYYINLKRRPRNARRPRRNIGRFFHLDIFEQAANYLQLINLVQMALDLRIPLEYLVYGMTSKRLIGQYNYSHYQELNKFHDDYVKLQLASHHTITDLLERLHHHMSYGKIADELSMSRQNVYRYLSGDNIKITKRDIFDKLCQMAGQRPIQVLTYPQVSQRCLKALNMKYISKFQK